MNLSSSLNLISESPFERDELRKLKTIINLLLEHADSTQFRQPVDWKGLELMDYTRIVKKPMDLGTVSEKLQLDEYRFIEEALDDLQLIWDNCKSYNESGSWIYSMADRMEKYYKKLIKNYFTSIPIAASNVKPIQTGDALGHKQVRVSARRVEKLDSKIHEQQGSEVSEDHRRVLDRLKKLGPQQLGEVVDLIMTENPEAFSQKEDKCIIFISQIEQGLWRQIREKLCELEEGEDHLVKKVKL